jgi:hypothetical protein
MVEVVLRLASMASHHPEASIGVAIALEHRNQFVTAAGRTGQFVKLNAQCHYRIVLNRHTPPPQ